MTAAQRDAALIANGPAQAAAAAQASIATVAAASTAVPTPTTPSMPISVTTPFQPAFVPNQNPSNLWTTMTSQVTPTTSAVPPPAPAPARTDSAAPAPRPAPPRATGMALRATLLNKTTGGAGMSRVANLLTRRTLAR